MYDVKFVASGENLLSIVDCLGMAIGLFGSSRPWLGPEKVWANPARGSGLDSVGSPAQARRPKKMK